MATYADLKTHHRIFMNTYPFSHWAIKDNPSAKLEKPLSEAKFALITSAGLRLPEDAPFEAGTTSFRILPNDIDPQILIEDHKSSSFDHSGVQQDKNLALPIDRFRELAEEGKIGAFSHRSFSFMGSILAPGSLIREDAPKVAKLLKEDGVDAVFLAPV